MLLLTFVALFSTIAFYRRAKQIGISPGRAASLPFVVLGIFLALGFVGGYLIAHLGNAANISNTTILTMAWLLDLFLILAYLKFIHRNWQALYQTAEENG